MKYTDKLKSMMIKFNISFSLNILLVLLILHGQYRMAEMSKNYQDLDKKLDESLTKSRIVLTPAASRRDIVDYGSMVSDSYVEGVSREIVEKLEA